MMRMFPAVAVIVTGLITPAFAQGSDEAKALARLYAGARYFLERAEPDKARRYAQSMYLLLKDQETEHSADYADRLFYVATGIRESRRAFFRSMDVVEQDGSLSVIPKEEQKKSYTCRRQNDGSTACSEN